MNKPNVIADKSFELAVSIVKCYKLLIEQEKEFVLSKQLLRSGTSVGANIREAQHAQTTADFLHKLSIAQKECEETKYWLELLNATDYLSTSQLEPIYEQCIEVQKIVTKTIITTKQNRINSK
ncbi:MAG: four helix bundle protein [Chitinophagales bacterium]|jgi:four helix bundle protein|nr:four helix bundle protein [Chitinophagales bacterium]